MKQRRLIPIKKLTTRCFGGSGLDFGGSHLKNSHAKSARPFSPRAAIHTVLRTRSPFTLLKRGRRARIEVLVATLAKRHHVHIHRFANAGNHLHLLIECRERRGFRAFLRTLSGSIARFIKLEDQHQTALAAKAAYGAEDGVANGAINGAANGTKDSLWLQRPWTRILPSRGRALLTASRYVDLNDIEGSYWGVTRAEARRLQSIEVDRGFG